MKILNVKLNGLYTFDNYEYNLTVPRKVKNLYRPEKNEVSRINPKDINIIIGTNASGKTTFSKALFLIERVITGYDIKKELYSFGNKEDVNFDVEFEYLITANKEDYVFKYCLKIVNGNFKYEKLEYLTLKIDGSYNRKNFKTITEIDFTDYDSEISQSLIFNDMIHTDGFFVFKFNEVNSKSIVKIAKNFGYTFYIHDIWKERNMLNDIEVPIYFLNKFLRAIDPSIKKVDKLVLEENAEFKGDYSVTFNNGDHIIISNNDLSVITSRVSFGTKEAIQFAFRIFPIFSGFYSTVVLDEQFTHLHSELEKELLGLLISFLPLDSQLFYTTHNLETLKMNLPLSAYSIMYKESDGSSKVIHPEQLITQKNDRDALYKIVENDYFGTFNDFGFLHDYVEMYLDEEE